MQDLPPVIPLFDFIQILDEGNANVNQHLVAVNINRVIDAGLV